MKLQRRMSACNWIKVNQPEIWKDAQILMLSAYLNYRLTGHCVDSCANLIGPHRFDSKERRWMRMSDLRRCIFEVEPEKLYSVVEPGERIGFVHRWAGSRPASPRGHGADRHRLRTRGAKRWAFRAQGRTRRR